MNPENIPVQSTKSLINACLIAVLLAMVILFTAVLPAEYGIDPTGLGKKMGLIALSEFSQKAESQISENCNKPAQEMVATATTPETVAGISSSAKAKENASQKKWKDTVKIVIPPNKGLEYKFAVAKDGLLEYAWQTDGEPLYFDFHGEPKGATDGYFKSYVETTDSRSEGKLIAPFEGIHGWFWENKSDRPVTVTLGTNGTYQVIGLLH